MNRTRIQKKGLESLPTPNLTYSPVADTGSAPVVTKPQEPSRFALAALLLLYLIFASLHAVIVPTGQTGYQNAPDEAAHVNFVRSIASFHLPTHDHPTPFSSTPVGNDYEWHQPPLYYLLASPFLMFGDRGVRFFSILCGLCALLLIYRAARLLFPADGMLALLAVGVAALTPTHIAITSTVNNDVLLELCFSASLLLLIAALKHGFTPRIALWLGLSIGAAMLTKVTGMLLLPVFGFALFLMWRSGVSWKTLARQAGMTFGLILMISGWWFVRNQALYGQLLPLQLFSAAFGGTAQAAPLIAEQGWVGYYLQAGLMTFASFWAVYGTARDVRLGIPRFLPIQIYELIAIACLCAAAGITKLHFQRKALYTPSQLHGIWICILTIALVGMSYLAFISKYYQMQGRYLFPAMLAICMELAMGFRGLFPVRWKNPACTLLLALLVVIDLAYLRFIQP